MSQRLSESVEKSVSQLLIYPFTFRRIGSSRLTRDPLRMYSFAYMFRVKCSAFDM